MSEIIIKSKGKSYVVCVDDTDLESISKYKWYIHTGGSGTSKLYVYSDSERNKGGKRIVMHRFIMGVSDSDIAIDHIDNNGLNNQRKNLRIANTSQNSCNRGIVKSRNLSGFKGVSFKPSHNKYSAIIRHKGVNHWGGHFDTPEEAAIKYNELARIYHGEFAYQNPV